MSDLEPMRQDLVRAVLAADDEAYVRGDLSATLDETIDAVCTVLATRAHPSSAVIRAAVEHALDRATADTEPTASGWETTAAVLAFEVQRLRDLLCSAKDQHPRVRRTVTP